MGRRLDKLLLACKEVKPTFIHRIKQKGIKPFMRVAFAIGSLLLILLFFKKGDKFR